MTSDRPADDPREDRAAVEKARTRLGRRMTRGLLSFLGPAQVSPYSPREPGADPEADPTVPAGYRLEWYTDSSGMRRRSARKIPPDELEAPENRT